MATEYTIFKELRDMFPAPAGVATPVVMYKSDDGVLAAYGTTVPTTASTYAEGCTFYKVNGTNGNVKYVNVGSYTSPDFQKVLTGETSGSAAGVGPSPLIWDDAPLLAAMLDPTQGIHYWNDFLDYGVMANVTTGTAVGGLHYVERTEGTLSNLPTIPGGVVELSSVNNTADQGGSMLIDGFEIEPLTGTTIRMEWRALVSEDGGQCFMGLCDDSITAPVTSSDAITVNDHIGFYRDAGTGDADWTVGIGDGAAVEQSDDVATSVKTTYHKFGIVATGIGAVAGSVAKFYFDGVLVYTTTDIDDYPLLLMCPMFQMDGDGTDIVSMNIDWLRILVSHATGLCREA